MTDGFSVPGHPTSASAGPSASASAGSLAVSIARLAELADRLGVPRGEVFDVHHLSEASGVPADVVGALLEGQPAGEPDLQARFLQRFDLLRTTRLKPNGRRYTQQEIADGAGMSRQQAGALINGDRRPTMEHCDAIQRFFKVHAGFLTAEDADALDGALQRTEQTLLLDYAGGDGDPLERLLQDHGVRGIAWRAAQLPSDKHRDKVAEWLDMLLESVKPTEPREPREP